MITGIATPGKGTVVQTDARSLKWSIPSLGVQNSESAALEFFIRHVGKTSGTKLVNRSIVYSDTEGNQVTFPDPSVTVDCEVVVTPEPCPIPVDLSVSGCEQEVIVDLGETDLGDQGQILQLDTILRNVCPNRRVALAAVLSEVDRCGKEHPRGFKTMTVPAHQKPGCRDVRVR